MIDYLFWLSRLAIEGMFIVSVIEFWISSFGWDEGDHIYRDESEIGFRKGRALLEFERASEFECDRLRRDEVKSPIYSNTVLLSRKYE